MPAKKKTKPPEDPKTQYQVDSPDPPQEAYKPKRTPLKAAGLDQHAAHKKRHAALQAERDVHNTRTGGG